MIDKIGQIRKFGVNGVQMRSVISENVGHCPFEPSPLTG